MLRFRAGTGEWEAFLRAGLTLDQVYEAAADWKQRLAGVSRPWLCWNVDPAWCTIQQRLVAEVGWTPVVGFDPRVGPPPLEPGAILIDFNEKFQLPTMWLHFPMEFSFLFSERLAFWHADLLLRRDKMQKFADQFAALPDGTMAAVASKFGLSSLMRPYEQRYWEVLGCNTQGSSADQFRNGCGWWSRFQENPNNSIEEKEVRSKYYWDSGVGVYFWAKKRKGKVVKIPESLIDEGHFTSIKRKNYIRASPISAKRNLSLELSKNNDLLQACMKLGIADLLVS